MTTNLDLRILEEELHSTYLQQFNISASQPKSPSRRRFFKKVVTYTIGAGAVIGAAYLSNLIKPVAGQNINLTAPLSTTPITLDGKWTTDDEWKDGAEAHSTGALYRMKHTGNYVNLLGDYFNSRPASGRIGDEAWFYFDTLKNGGNTPQVDDRAYGLVFDSSNHYALRMAQGTGSGWKDVTPVYLAASSTDPSNNPYSKNPHAIYEFEIPKSELPSNADSFNVRFSMHDGGTNAWTTLPGGSSKDVPSQWNAELKLLPYPIPEFFSWLLSLGLPLTLALTVMEIYKRKRRMQT